MTSPCVLDGILRLAAVFSGRSMKVVQGRGVGALHLQAMSSPPAGHSPFSHLRLIAGFALLRTRLFVEAVPDTWEPTFHGGGHAFGFDEVSFDDAVQQRMWFSCVALISRLGTLHSFETVGPLLPSVSFSSPYSSFPVYFNPMCSYIHNTLFVS